MNRWSAIAAALFSVACATATSAQSTLEELERRLEAEKKAQDARVKNKPAGATSSGKVVVLICEYQDASIPNVFFWSAYTATYTIEKSKEWEISDAEYTKKEVDTEVMKNHVITISRFSGVATQSYDHYEKSYDGTWKFLRKASRQSKPCQHADPAKPRI